MLVALSDRDAATRAQVGPKAATLARLRAAGLPVPDGFCLTAGAYRAHLAAVGREVTVGDRRRALNCRLVCLRDPLDRSITDAVALVWERLAGAAGALVAVRSSALLEDSPGASFAGQFETFLGVADARDLVTAVRACWASLWSTRALRYLGERGLDPAATAMAVLIQRLVPARAAGGALSRTPDGSLVLTAAWGLGPAVAHGEVVPDRYVLRREGPAFRRVTPGRKPRCLGPGDGGRWRSVAPEQMGAPCLTETEALALARLVLAVEAALGEPVEVEWALDELGFHVLQARPLDVAEARDTGPPGPGSALLVGQPAGVGRAAGPARVVRHEADLARVEVGDVLVTRVAGPALASVLPRVAAVVAELGGSTSHLAALARERGLPAVLGVADATRRLTDGCLLVVDGVTGAVHESPSIGPAPASVEAWRLD
ncbi:MAG TPA: PEP/pyruvate-binding domain-containing protein [Methylomirabilota bacterium]|jgi:pyruvate,water dikinase|nr:PEP/pyruvate-binding domain-containing protein [Methylomirabilota bacterium]